VKELTDIKSPSKNPANAEQELIDKNFDLEKQFNEMKLELENLKLQQGAPRRLPKGVIYIAQTRHCIAANNNVHKIGKSIDIIQRRNGYPKGTLIIAYFACIDPDEMERKLLTKLRATFKERKDFGAEYFECSLTELVGVVTQEYLQSEQGIAQY